MTKKFKNCKLFDGKDYYKSADIIVDDGIISDIKINNKNENNDNNEKKYFIMPGLIDAHTHTNSIAQLKKLQKCGITCTCSVVAPNDIKNIKYMTKAYSSYSMALGGITNAKAFVENEVRHNADYIKVIIEDKPRMSFTKIKYDVLCDIVKYAHQYNKKVAAHAVIEEDMRMCVDAGVDILIHIPLQKVISDNLVKQIIEKKIAVIPTLVMMREFSKLWIMGYRKKDLEPSMKSVRKLYESGVSILVGTDANSSPFAPSVKFGNAIFDEMKLLNKAGVPNKAILEGATSKAAEAFAMKETNTISIGNKADFIVLDGNPIENIEDIAKIKSVYIDGTDINKKL